MDTKTLKRMIRHSVRKQLAEMAAAASSPPTDFASFRRLMARAMEAAGAPEDLVAELAEIDVEGGGVAQVAYDAWQNISSEIDGETDPRELRNIWQDISEYYVHDAVIDMVDEYSNAWNYAPGHRPAKVDSKALAVATAAEMNKLIK